MFSTSTMQTTIRKLPCFSTSPAQHSLTMLLTVYCAWLVFLLCMTSPACASLQNNKIQVQQGNLLSQPNNCSACADRELFKQITKDAIKDEILRKLGLKKAPNVTLADIRDYNILPIVRQSINEMTDHSKLGMMADQGHGSYGNDDYHFQTSQVSILATSPPSSEATLLHKRYKIQYFKLNDRVIGSQHNLVEAKLWIHLPAAPSANDIGAKIHVYYVGMDKKGKSTLYKAKDISVQLRLDRGGSVDINLARLTKIWMKSPAENLGIVIRVKTGPNHERELRIDYTQPQSTPVLQLDITEGGRRSRAKRTTDRTCSDESDAEETSCCMWPLLVDFNEFGWDWVLFPRTYEANFCSGDCSLGVISDYPHTHFVNLQSAAGPCCAPRKMSSISMLYLDQDKNVIMGKLPSMKVERCGCSYYSSDESPVHEAFWKQNMEKKNYVRTLKKTA